VGFVLSPGYQIDPCMSYQTAIFGVMKMRQSFPAVAGIAAALTGLGLAAVAVTTAAPAGANPVYCNTYGGAGWSNTQCSGGFPPGGIYCNTYGGASWSNTQCSGGGLAPGGVLCNSFGGNGWANTRCS